MLCTDCTIYGLKCLIAAAMDSVSISHDNQAICRPRSFALKNQASFNLPLRITNNVAPTPHCLTEPSVTIAITHHLVEVM